MDEIDKRLGSITDCLYRVTIKAVITLQSKILLVKEPEGWYSLPGGGLDYGETIKDGLLRELQEEVGINPSDLEVQAEPIFLLYTGVVDGIPRFSVYYNAKLLNNTVKNNELTFKWVSPKELNSLLLSPTLNNSQELLKTLIG